MILFYLSLTFRLHSLKELNQNQRRNHTNLLETTTFRETGFSKKIRDVTDNHPACGQFSPQIFEDTFTNVGDFHFCNRNNDLWNLCNEYTNISIIHCYANYPEQQFKNLDIGRENPGNSTFTRLLRTEPGMPYGLIYIDESTSKIINTNFSYSSAKNDGKSITSGQLITLTGGGTHTFQNCEFRYNGQVPLGNDGDPSTIGISGHSVCTFTNLRFLNEIANPYPDKVANIRAIAISEQARLTLTQSTFTDLSTWGTSSKGGAALYLDSSANVYITSTTFTNCVDKSSQGNAIFVTSKAYTVTIQNCSFIDCFQSGNNKDQNSIYLEGGHVILNQNTITFTEASNSCRCVYIKNCGHFEITANTFQKAHIGDKDGAGFKYACESDSQTQLEVSGNIFDNVQARDGAAFYIERLTEEDKTGITTNTIKNCQDNNNVGSFVYYKNMQDSISDDQTYYTLSGFTFESNQGFTKNFFKVVTTTVQYPITIYNCIFKQNIGIALFLSEIENKQIQSFTIMGCTFENNQNTNGAIIDMNVKAEVAFTDNCQFKNNTVNSSVIAFNCKTANVEQCDFVQNNGLQCHCIFTISAENLIVSLTRFCDNSNPNAALPCILSTIDSDIFECTFENTNKHLLSGSIKLQADANLHVDQCNFNHTNSGNGENGSGPIWYTPGGNTNGKVIIENCEFKSNKGDYGVALYLKVSKDKLELNNLNFDNNEFNHNLIHLDFFSSETYTIDRLTFTNNQLNGNEGKPCGGSGIYAKGLNKLIITQCKFSHNTAKDGGGFGWINPSQTEKLCSVELEDCTFESNIANNKGGGCCFDIENKAILSYYHFMYNQAGAIHFCSTPTTITDCDFNGDISINDGFACFANDQPRSYRIQNCKFQNLSGRKIFRLYTPSTDGDITFSSNTFNNISGDADGCLGLELKLDSNIEILDCKISNCSRESTNGQITIDPSGLNYDDNNAALILTRVEFNGELNAIPTRAIYIQNGDERFKKVRLESCIFRNYYNYRDNGAAIYFDTHKCPIINNCSFEHFQCYNVISGHRPGEIASITACSFIDIKLYPTTESRFGVMYIPGVKILSLYNFTFIRCGSSDSNQRRPALELPRDGTKLDVIDCYFEENGPYTNGAAINAANTKKVSIIGTTFIKNQGVPSPDGLGATDFNLDPSTDGSLEILYSQILPNYFNEENILIGFKISAPIINLQYNIINYTEQSNKNGIVVFRIESAQTTHIQDNIFHNTHYLSLLYLNSTDLDEIHLINNTWDNNRQYHSHEISNKCAFHIHSLNLIEFRNNTVKNCVNTDGYTGFLQGKENLTIEECIFENNQCSKGGGTGLTFGDKAMRIEIQNCQFRNNFAVNAIPTDDGCGGALQFGVRDNLKLHSYSIYNCNFNMNRADRVGGAICIYSELGLNIENCSFTSNRANQLSNEGEPQGGGAIFIKGPTTGNVECDHRIHNCQFESNYAQTDSHALHFEGNCLGILTQCKFIDNSKANAGAQISTKMYGDLEITDCNFTRRVDSTRCRAIHILEGKINLHDCQFNNLAMIQGGSAILIDSLNTFDGGKATYVTIKNNKFTDCGTQGYVVKCKGPYIHFENNAVMFTHVDQSCGYLDIASGSTPAQYNVINNYFHRCTTLGGGGAFHYDNGNPNSKLFVDNNTFEDLHGDTQICFYIEAKHEITFSNNIIKDNRPDNTNAYVCAFNFKGRDQLNVLLENDTFLNNECYSDYGGGAGIWFQNKENRDADDSISYYLEFKNCTFDSNHACYRPAQLKNGHNGKGGAFQLGWTETTSQTKLTFTDCTFVHNYADKQGGALSISVVKPVSITGCYFNNNTAADNNNGGALYFEPDFDWAHGHFDEMYCESITIEDCIFNDNKANDGCAICAHLNDIGEYTTVHVDSCQFNDNGNSANCILTECKLFEITNSQISYTADKTQTSRPLSVFGGLLVDNVQFENIKYTGNSELGTTIYLAPSATPVSINGSTLTNCGTDKSKSVIYAKSLVLSISYSIFKFDDSSKASGAIHIETDLPINDLQIIGNTFFKCNTNGNYKSKATVYYKCNKVNSQDENIVVSGNTFDQCKNQDKDGIAFSILPATDSVVFSKNTFQNFGSPDQASTYIFLFAFQAAFNQLTLDNCTFKNIVSDSNFGGGTGFWVERAQRIFDLKFEKCYFLNSTVRKRENLAQGHGGGLQFGITDTNNKANIYIKDCVFLGNNAPIGGGGLSLDVKGEVSIENTKFEENAATENGGAIMISNKIESQTISIKNCQFFNNQAKKGNAIYIPRCRDVLIQKCNFTDNFRNSNDLSPDVSIEAEVAFLNIENTFFQHTRDEISGRALDVSASEFNFTNSIITHCSIADPDAINAIYIYDTVKSSRIQNSLFEDDGNQLHNGFVIRSESEELIFDGNIVNFTSLDRAASALRIPYKSKLCVTKSTFTKCYFTTQNSASCIHYEAQSRNVEEEIVLQEDTFSDNGGAYCSCVLITATELPIIRNLTFARNNEDKDKSANWNFVLFFAKRPDEFTFENIVFEDNYFRHPTEKNGGGIGLWAAETNSQNATKRSYDLKFDECKFIRNHAMNCGGGAFSYGHNSDTVKYIILTFNNCQFIENECPSNENTGGGGALNLASPETTTIKECIFENNHVNGTTQKLGHAIYAAQNSLLFVTDCTFNDNGDDDGKDSVIQLAGQDFTFYRSTIQYSPSTGKGCRGIWMSTPGEVNLINSNFIRCDSKSEGGALYFNCSETSEIEEVISVEGCTFDSCLGSNGAAMLLKVSNPPALYQNRFINHRSGHYVISIFFTSFVDVFYFDQQEFSNNNCQFRTKLDEEGNLEKPDGGGSGIWIANQEEIANGRPCELVFRACTWNSNESPSLGGAFHYGSSKTVIGTEITFEDCTFTNNTAVGGGGAVSLATYSPTIFSRCQFSYNKVTQNSNTRQARGAAIYINSETPLCQISNCKFSNQSATEGNAIYATRNVHSLHITDNTVFNNCGFGDGTVIITNALEFHFRDSTIQFGERNNNLKCRGIKIADISTTFISGSKFFYCKAPDNDPQGGGLLLSPVNNVEGDQEDFELENTEFRGCSGRDGCAALLTVNVIPAIHGLIISEHDNTTATSYFKIKSSIFQSNFILSGCTFYKNKFLNSKGQDGGGSGFIYQNGQSTLADTTASITFENCNWTRNIGFKGGAYAHSNKLLSIQFKDCIFEHNQVQKGGGTGGALYISHNGSVIVDSCVFYRNMCYGSDDQSFGGAIVFDNNCSQVEITNATFQRNQALDGHAILTTEKFNREAVLQIRNCTFRDNSNGEIGYQILHRGAGIRIQQTNIEYSLVRLHAGGVRITSKSVSEFDVCNFVYCEIPTQPGGGIQLLGTPNADETPDQLTITGCTFDRCNSTDGGGAFYIDASNFNTTQLSISGCTFKNHLYGFRIFYLKLPSTQNEITISECKFENNFFKNSQSDLGFGGCGIGFDGTIEQITFRDCNFIRNAADYIGGGFACNKPGLTIKFTGTEGKGCRFELNKCNGTQGGALYLAGNTKAEIDHTTFVNNQCKVQQQTSGINVFINVKNEVQITLCTFSDMKFEKDGNALYIGSEVTKTSIMATSFTNCGRSGSVIYSLSSNFSIYQSSITFNSNNGPTNARGIDLGTNQKTKVEISCNFTNCQSANGAAAFSFVSESATITNSYFDNCKGQSTLDITTVTLEALQTITFTNHVTEGSICSIEYTGTQQAATTFSNCYFINNKLIGTDANNNKMVSIKTQQEHKIEFLYSQFRLNSNTKPGGALYLTGDTFEYALQGCTFYNNTSSDKGGAIYADAKKPITISNKCQFAYNQAKVGGAIYIDQTPNVQFSEVQFGFNSPLKSDESQEPAYSAFYITGTQTLSLANITVLDNDGSRSSIYLEISKRAEINYSTFNFTISNSKPQFILKGGEEYTFNTNCFSHIDGLEFEEDPIYLQYETGTAKVNLDYTNCVNFTETVISVPAANKGTFDFEPNCERCSGATIEEVPPATPAQTPAATRSPSQSPKPTSTPPASQSPAPFPTQSPVPPTETMPTNDPANPDSSKDTKSGSSLGMIIGIVVAGVVLIAVVVILIYIFVFRNKSNQNQPTDSTAEISHEPVASINRTENAGSQDDPIWAGATATQDNPLFNGADDPDEDHMMQTGFEESWGENII